MSSHEKNGLYASYGPDAGSIGEQLPAEVRAQLESQQPEQFGFAESTASAIDPQAEMRQKIAEEIETSFNQPVEHAEAEQSAAETDEQERNTEVTTALVKELEDAKAREAALEAQLQALTGQVASLSQQLTEVIAVQKQQAAPEAAAQEKAEPEATEPETAPEIVDQKDLRRVVENKETGELEHLIRVTDSNGEVTYSYVPFPKVKDGRAFSVNLQGEITKNRKTSEPEESEAGSNDTPETAPASATETNEAPAEQPAEASAAGELDAAGTNDRLRGQYEKQIEALDKGIANAQAEIDGILADNVDHIDDDGNLTNSILLEAVERHEARIERAEVAKAELQERIASLDDIAERQEDNEARKAELDAEDAVAQSNEAEQGEENDNEDGVPKSKFRQALDRAKTFFGYGGIRKDINESKQAFNDEYAKHKAAKDARKQRLADFEAQVRDEQGDITSEAEIKRLVKDREHKYQEELDDADRDYLKNVYTKLALKREVKRENYDTDEAYAYAQKKQRQQRIGGLIGLGFIGGGAALAFSPLGRVVGVDFDGFGSSYNGEGMDGIATDTGVDTVSDGGGEEATAPERNIDAMGDNRAADDSGGYDEYGFNGLVNGGEDDYKEVEIAAGDHKGETIDLRETDIPGVGEAQDGTLYDIETGVPAFGDFEPNPDDLESGGSLTTPLEGENAEELYGNYESRLRTESLVFSELMTGLQDVEGFAVDMDGMTEEEFAEKLASDPEFYQENYEAFASWADENGIHFEEGTFSGLYETSGAVQLDEDGDRDMRTIQMYREDQDVLELVDADGNKLLTVRKECGQVMAEVDQMPRKMKEERGAPIQEWDVPERRSQPESTSRNESSVQSESSSGSESSSSNEPRQEETTQRNEQSESGGDGGSEETHETAEENEETHETTEENEETHETTEENEEGEEDEEETPVTPVGPENPEEEETEEPDDSKNFGGGTDAADGIDADANDYNPDTDDTEHSSTSGNGTESESMDGSEAAGSETATEAEGSEGDRSAEVVEEEAGASGDSEDGVVRTEEDQAAQQEQQEQQEIQDAADAAEDTSETTDEDVADAQSGLDENGRPIDEN